MDWRSLNYRLYPVLLRRSQRRLSTQTNTKTTNLPPLTAKTKTASGKNSRKPRGSELERGGYRTGSSSFPPQVDVTIVPFQTNQQGCSSLTDCCAVVKGRRPVGQLVELVQALLLVLVLELAVLILLLELKPELLSNPCFRSQCCHMLCRSQLHRSSQRRCIHRSIRQQSRNHKLAEPVMLHGEPIGRSQRVSMSEQKSRMGCSSIGYGEPGHRFRQQLRGELVRRCRSDRRRKRS